MGITGSMRSAKRRRLAAAAITLLLLIAALIAFRNPIVRMAAPAIVGMATGTKVSVDQVSLGGTRATLTGIRMSARGEPLAYVPKAELAYTLRGLLPGSDHRFGLRALTVYQPQITVVRNPDGTYNLPKLPSAGPSNKAAAPINMTLHVVGGSLTVIDKTKIDPSARKLSIEHVNFNADVHTDARTHYLASMAYVDNGISYPIRGNGLIDAAGITLHHWTAAHVPLAQLVNYSLNNANVRMQAGYLDNLDARYYGGISASAYMRGAQVSMQGVSVPIRNVHGPLDVTSAGLTTPRLVADLAGAPVFVTGGIYDLKAPKFRLSVHANSDVARLKKLTSASSALPMRGPVDLSMLVEGAVRAPLALISLRSPEIDYRAMPLQDADGTIIFDGKTAHILHFTLRYDGFSVASRGSISLQPGPNAVEAVAGITGPSDRIPYAASVIPGMQLHGLLLATANNLKQVQTQGVLTGSGNAARLSSVFQVASNGIGSIALTMGNTVRARIALDHPHGRITALVHANGLTVRPTRPIALPGLHVTSLPPVQATIDGDLFAEQFRNEIGLSGNAELRNASYNGISLVNARARFAGPPGNVGVSSLIAHGSFGTLEAKGRITGTSHVALVGRFNGSLAALSALAGHLPASGTVEAPIALVYSGGRSIAQIRDARFSRASIRGVPINGLSATLGAQGKGVQVFAARATIARSASALAAGSLGSNGNRLALSVGHLNLSALRGAGLPVSTGYANLAAQAAGSLTDPRVRGAILLDRMQYARYPINGSAAFAYAGDTLTVDDALIGLGPAILAAQGSVDGIRIGAPMVPRYDLDAVLSAADARSLIALTQPKLAKEYIEGSIDARVHVSGSGRDPLIAGAFDVPEGSVHGLAFRNLHGTIRGRAQDLRVRDAGVTVGSTVAAFNAELAGRSVRTEVSAPDANLADFNDYFDTGDTLAGSGGLTVDLAMAGGSIQSSGNVDLSSVRFRRFDIGNAAASWHTSGHTIAMRADVGGVAGRAHLAGSVQVPQFTSVAQIATSSQVDMTGTLRDVDLGDWLPMMGMNAPVVGLLSADASVDGRYPDLSLKAKAAARKRSCWTHCARASEDGDLGAGRARANSAGRRAHTIFERKRLRYVRLSRQRSASHNVARAKPGHRKTHDLGFR